MLYPSDCIALVISLLITAVLTTGMLSSRLGPAAVGHAIVFRVALDGETLTVRDPLSGEYEQIWAEFSKTWLGVTVMAERRPGT